MSQKKQIIPKWHQKGNLEKNGRFCSKQNLWIFSTASKVRRHEILFEAFPTFQELLGRQEKLAPPKKIRFEGKATNPTPKGGESGKSQPKTLCLYLYIYIIWTSISSRIFYNSSIFLSLPNFRRSPGSQ